MFKSWVSEPSVPLLMIMIMIILMTILQERDHRHLHDLNPPAGSIILIILMILHRRVHPQLGLGAECGSPVRLAGTKVAILLKHHLQCQGLVMVMVMMILMITNDMIMIMIRRFAQRRQEFRMWDAKVSGKLQMRKRLVMIMIVLMILMMLVIIIMIMLILALIICPMMPNAERRGAPSNANVLALIPMFQ